MNRRNCQCLLAVLLACAIYGLASAAAKASTPVFSVTDYGSVTDGAADASPAIERTIAAAVEALKGGAKHATVFFPAGRYRLGRGITVPSHISIAGKSAADTIIVFAPPRSATGGYVFSTHQKFQLEYLEVSRADDPSHDSVPAGDYSQTNYVFLTKPEDLQYLRKLGVPSSVDNGYPGLAAQVSSGATLANNSGNPGATATDEIADQLRGDPQINPAPSVLMTIVAVTDDGKVIFSAKNRFNWGGDYHPPGESLDVYRSPQKFAVAPDGRVLSAEACADCPLYGKKQFVAGPAWITPAGDFAHDISFENLTFEVDLDRDGVSQQQTHGLDLSYSYDIGVIGCSFRNNVSPYPLLSVRAFDLVVDRSRFEVSTYAGVTLDSGSGYEIRNSIFNSVPLPREVNYDKLPKHALNFIEFDEGPFDIVIANNEFDGLPADQSDKHAGVVMFGTGGGYLRVVDNVFKRIDVSAVYDIFFNDNVIFDSNSMKGSAGVLSGACCASGVSAVRNYYDDAAPVHGSGHSGDRPGVLGISSYNKQPIRNYVCYNHGVSLEEWFLSTTYFTGNTYQNGGPMTVVPVHSPVKGVPNEAREGPPLDGASLADIEISARGGVKEGRDYDAVVSLASPAKNDTPIYLHVVRGDYGALRTFGGVYVIPAGQKSVRIQNAVSAIRSGEAVLQARSVCSRSSDAVETDVVVKERGGP